MLIKRMLSIPKNKNIFIFGPRQTGKSTLINKIFSEKESHFYNLLEVDTYNKLLANPQIFRHEVEAICVTENKKNIIVDEVQKIPQILDEVHNLIEKKLPCNFILSGSSSRKLKRFQANMLAGRAWSFHLFPFVYKEIKKKFSLDDVLRFGSLPSVNILKTNNEKQEVLRSYVNTYIKEEIEMEANIRNLGSFLRFLPIAAAENGEILNYSNVAREAGIKSPTVKEYYKILEDTLIGFFLLPYNRSVRKRLVRHPKFYFFDLGVVSALNKKLKTPLLESSYEYGKAFEHFFICEIFRLNEYLRLDLDISFYRTERGAEVDLVLQTPKGETIAVEIKSTKNPVRKHCSGLYSFKKVVPEAKLFLISRASNSMKFDDVLVLPWEKSWEYILDL